MPIGSKLNNVWLESVITDGELQHVQYAYHYGITGMVTNVHDPDSTISYDTVWDEQVNKDTLEGYYAASTLLDTEGLDSTPEFEVGEIDLESLMGVELENNTEIFRRRKMVSFPANPVGFNGTNQYWPCDHFKIHLKGGPRVTSPSVAMFGFSSPSMDQTQGMPNLPTEKEWLIFQFIDTFLEDMFKHLIGMSQPPDYNPGDDASESIAALLEDKMIEPDGTFMPGNSWTCISKITWDITIDGFKGVSTLTSE